MATIWRGGDQAGSNLPTYTVVTTRRCPVGVVAFTLMELSRTVMTGGVVSASTGAAGPPAAQRELAEARHTPSVEHLQHRAHVCQC